MAERLILSSLPLQIPTIYDIINYQTKYFIVPPAFSPVQGAYKISEGICNLALRVIYSPFCLTFLPFNT